MEFAVVLAVVARSASGKMATDFALWQVVGVMLPAIQLTVGRGLEKRSVPADRAAALTSK